jgi:hypothetical protein
MAYWPPVCMYVPLTKAGTVGHIMFIFGIKECMHHRLMPVEYGHSDFANKAQKQNGDFLENSS